MTSKPLRIWVDGCFDMMHWGHANAIRQAKKEGHYLVVGVHSDAEILANKGPTVMKEQERYDAVAACKWVDEIVPGAPYVTSLDVMDKYNCDVCIHGDDLVTTPDGHDTYQAIKDAGRFKTVPRTEGVSTTALVRRMLEATQPASAPKTTADTVVSPYTGVSKFLPSTRRIAQFAEGSRDPKPTDNIVYTDGAFDVFHPGHIAFLKEAKKQGDYLIVGVFPDELVNRHKGGNGTWPIMNMWERVLSVLSCCYVDEVLIGAPWELTEEIIRNHKISVVVTGRVSDDTPAVSAADWAQHYAAAQRLGMLREIESGSTLTTTQVVHRIVASRQQFEERNRKKEAKELSEMSKAN